MIVDKYTKALEYILYRKDLDISDLTKLLINNICNRFGISEIWFSDKQNTFAKAFFILFCYFMKAQRRLFIVFHPQTDGQTKC